MLDDVDKLARSPYAAGVAGSLVALRFAPGSTWVERAVNVVAGSITAAYVSPALAEWLRITSPGLQSGLAFLLGLFGLSLAAAALQAMREAQLGQVITGWISRR